LLLLLARLARLALTVMVMAAVPPMLLSSVVSLT
jgi:hypothetical protein